jgi:transcriptional regulator with XRE-family HTH domain
MSTRSLAQRAGVSQAYVVALEKAYDGALPSSPTPTVDVICGIAFALGLDPVELTESVLRPAPRHTLLVLEDAPGAHGPDALEYARQAASPVDHWVWVASDLGHSPRRDRSASRIDLRRHHRDEFRPPEIFAAMPGELAAIGPVVRGRTIGMVFAESAHVISLADDPQQVLEVEHQWGRVVRDAARAVDTRVGWNVCVYELSVLQALPQPVEAVCDLLTSHDTIWSAHDSRVKSGAAAARRILQHLRPADTPVAQWRDTVQSHLTRLGLAA